MSVSSLTQAPASLETDRLLLRRFRANDRQVFAAINACPHVMEYMYKKSLSREESDQFVARIEACFGRNQYGLWALERKGDGAFIGYTGLWPAPEAVAFSPKIEIGWRLAHHAWGDGYATEAAKAALQDGFARGLEEVTSFTSRLNQRSIAVMERLGMVRDAAGDFYHPNLPEDHPLAWHLLYRLKKPENRISG